MQVEYKEVQVDGGIYTLYSYDGGITWAMDYKDVQKRQRAVEVFEEYREKQRRKKPGYKKPPKAARARKGLYGPMILPIRRHGSPVLGKDKGKNQKYRRNLRRKKEANDQVRLFMGASRVGKRAAHIIPDAPLHRHKCYNATHRKSFDCMCAKPIKKIQWCGGNHCLQERSSEVFAMFKSLGRKKKENG